MVEIASLHTPVMLERCIELLQPADSNGFLIDCTLGLGGHTLGLLESYPETTVIGIDRDPHALKLAGERLEKFGNRFIPAHGCYDQIAEIAAKYREQSRKHFVGALFDLGVSSMQLDFAERGFAYAKDAPLDMRMDQTTGSTAADLIAELSQQELAQLLKKYGDEPLAARYAAAIVAARAKQPILRSEQLVEILQQATPAKLKQQRHPAKRTFQALRVAVNDELAILSRALDAALESVDIGGTIVAMAYQSHEDKLVKTAFANAVRDNTPANLPQQLPEYAPHYRLLTRGAEKASAAEQELNPRAIPVRLRAVKRVRK